MSRSSSQSSTSNLDQYKNFYEDLQVEKKFSADLEVFTEAVTRLEYLHRQMISSITIYRGYETQHEGVSANYAAVARRVRDEAYDGVVTIQRQIAECRKLIVRLGESLQLNLYTKTPYEKEIAFLENINVKSSFIGSLEEYYTKEAHGEEIEDLRQKNEELIAAYDRRPKLDADQYLHDNLDKLVQEVNDTPLEEFKPHHLDVIRYVYDNAQAVINEIKQNEGDEEDDPTKQPLKKALAATKGSGSFTLFTSKTVKDTEYSIVELSKNASGAKAKGFVNKKLLEKVNQHYVADGSTDLLAEDKKEIIEAAIKLQGKVYIKAKSQGEAKNAAYYNKQFTEYCENKCKGRARALVVTQTAADEDVDFNLGEDKDDNEISIMYAPIMTDGMTDKYIGYNLGPGIKSMIGAVDDFVRRHIHSNYSPVNETACNSGKIKNWWSAMFMRGEATRHVIKVQDGSTETKVLGSVRPGTNLSTLYNKKDKPTNEMSLQEKREAAFLLMQAADTLIDFLDHCEKKGDMIPRGCDFKPVVWKDEKGKIQARFFLLDVDHASFLTQDAMEKSQLGGGQSCYGTTVSL